MSGTVSTSDLEAAGAAFACAVLLGLPTLAPRLLQTDFGADLQLTLRNDPFLADLAVKVQASPNCTVTSAGAGITWRNWLREAWTKAPTPTGRLLAATGSKMLDRHTRWSLLDQ